MRSDTIVFAGQRYEYWRPNAIFSLKPSGNTNVQITARFGGGVDYDNGRAATSVVNVQTSLEYRPVSRVNLWLSHSLDQLSIEGGRLYRASLVQTKGIYHINVRTFVRAILQYTDITRAQTLYAYPVDARSRRLFSQFLFSFKLNPQTVFFAGYSDNSVGAGEAQGPIDLARQNRTFFVKLGYAWTL